MPEVNERHVYNCDIDEPGTIHRLQALREGLPTTYHYHAFGKECNDRCDRQNYGD